MGASQRRGGISYLNYFLSLKFYVFYCRLLWVLGCFQILGHGGGKKFWMRREGEGAKNFRRIFEIVDIFQILG